MENQEIEQVIHREVCAERTRTVLAAVIGIPVGLFLSLGVPIYLGLHESSVAAVVDFGLTAYCGPGLFYLLGNKCKRSGLRFLTEWVGFTGMGAVFPGMLFRFGAASLPSLLLVSMYEDDGRYQLALNLMKTTDTSSCKSLEAGKMLLLYNSGHYEEALAGARRLMSETEEAYSKDQSGKFKTDYVMVHAHALAMLHNFGNKEEARSIWETVKQVARFEPTETAVAFPLNALAYAGVTIGDWSGALHFANQSRETIKSALGSRWLAGEIALNHAFCYFHQGDLSKAEQELGVAMHEWNMIMPSSAAALAQAYYCKGLIEQSKENHSGADDQFQFAIEIIRRRMGAMHPNLLPILASYAQTLFQLDRLNEAQALLSEAFEIRAFHKIDEDSRSESGSEALPISCTFAPLAELDAGAATKAKDKELSLEEIAKDAVLRESIGLRISVWLWLLFIPFSISIIATSTMGLVCVLVAINIIDYLFLKFYQSLRQQGLLRKLESSRVESVALVLNQRKKFFDDLNAKIEQGSSSLIEGTKLTFDVSKRTSDQLFGNTVGKSIAAKFYVDAQRNVPLVAVVAGNAMCVSRPWYSKFAPTLRPLLRGCSALGGMVLVMGAGLMLYPFCAAPPEVVPIGKSPSEYLSLGRQYKVVGWTEQAREALGKAIEKGDPRVASEAKRYLETKLPRYPQPEAAVQLNIRGYNANGSPLGDGAEKIWLECINKYPNFEWPYANLGNKYVSQHKYKEGEAMIRKALEINPSYVNAWIHLSECKRKQRQFAEARQCINRALDLDPSDEGARLASLLPDF